MAIPTYVTSLNGMTGGKPFEEDGNVVIDASQIHSVGNNGKSIKSTFSYLAPLITMLEIEDLPGSENDVNIYIGVFRLSFMK